MIDSLKKIVARPVPEKNLQALSGVQNPVLRRIYASRCVASEDDVNMALDKLVPPSELMGIDAAVALLSESLVREERMLVIGDFDADGATSSALMVSALRAMGARHIDFLVPNRFEFGYGLTPEIVAVAAGYAPQLIITVDNGISSLAGVEEARKQGIKVLVTDHHLPGDQLPDADAILNPNQPGDAFPSKALAGVGVAFYLLMALRGHLDARGWFQAPQRDRPNLAEFLDLVALGTVADLVPLDRNNRILVQQGIQRIRAGRCRPGIRALLDIAGRNAARLVAADFGFAIGPRLNAAGRLDDMALGIECLLSDSPARAAELARELDMLNRERREIENDMKDQALQTLASLHLDTGHLPPGLCLYDADWHQGVIGILASRVKEHYHRPVIAFAPAGDSEVKGSARSIPGLHIRDTLDAIAARHPELLQKFGGHAMAAGLSINAANLPDFERAFHDEVAQRLDSEALTGVVESDGKLPDKDINLAFAEQLRNAGPWGQAFPEPVFDGRFVVVAVRVLADRHLKMSVRPQDSDRTVDAIAFNQADAHSPLIGECVHLAYRLDVNEYRGMFSLQLIVELIRPLN